MEKPTPELTISHQEVDGQGIYIAHIKDMADAKLTYKRTSQKLIIVDHTFVPPEMRGMGIAKKLVERVVLDARASDTKIDPMCPYVKVQIARHKEWHDVLN